MSNGSNNLEASFYVDVLDDSDSNAQNIIIVTEKSLPPQTLETVDLDTITEKSIDEAINKLNGDLETSSKKVTEEEVLSVLFIYLFIYALKYCCLSKQ